MSRWFCALCPVFASIAACSGASPDPDPSAPDDTTGVQTGGTGGTTTTNIGSASVGGGVQGNAGSQQMGSGTGGGASAEGGATTRADAASATEGGVLKVATLPLPAPGTPGIDYLSDLTEEAGATNGWGPFEKDQTNGWTGANDGCKPIDLFAGAKYTKGIGAHAYSKVTYKLGGAYRLFVSDIGFAFCETPGGTVMFQVFLDGNKAYDSGMFTKDSKRATTVNVDVTGKMKMDIVVTDGGDGLYGDHVAWAGARLMK